ncbi:MULTISPECIES: hypothetical protein [unclassified Caballeronia]|uniref:hypothetical protein n=1 Tax=unclassified Caballeronia TaxID=2646786 RepID=UPI00158AF2FC|nr:MULTISPECIES: hypothetical protein [unclassified Caballeronia]QSN63479.1 hypothetical protein JYK05_14715 [Caballeronia sp. M1242]
MQRSARARKRNRALDDARLQLAFRRAAVAMILFDPIAAEALLDLPDAELGRRFKISLARTIGRATALNLDLRAIREEGEQLRGRAKRRSQRRMSREAALVAEGKLLRAEIVCQALSISEKRLRKDVARRRIFDVDVEGTQYYPAFFLANELNRKHLAKIVRRLGGLDGWSKWGFFTEPNGSLADFTPLQALTRGEVTQVLRIAAALVGRSQKL